MSFSYIICFNMLKNILNILYALEMIEVVMKLFVESLSILWFYDWNIIHQIFVSLVDFYDIFSFHNK